MWIKTSVTNRILIEDSREQSGKYSIEDVLFILNFCLEDRRKIDLVSYDELLLKGTPTLLTLISLKNRTYLRHKLGHA